MKITIAGIIGSGKSTLAEIIAKKLGYKRHSSGDFMRQLASEKSITLIELSRIANLSPEIDKEIDNRQIEIGKKEDNFVIDGRLSWYCIPDSLKIYLEVSEEEASRRIFNDKKENRKKERFSSIEELIRMNRERKALEIKRYKEWYGINIHDKSHYDISLDTTHLSIDEVVGILMNKIYEFKE